MHAGHPFVRFAGIQLATGDFDCAHPLLMHLIKVNGLDVEQALWLSFLFMAHWNEASGWMAFQHSEPFKTIPTLTVEKNRRNLHGGRVHQHIASLRANVEHYGSCLGFVTRGFTDDRVSNWRKLLATLENLYGNGRWGSFTTAELLHKVNDIPVEPTDIANQGSTGPADGIQRLFGKCDEVSMLDAYAQEAYTTVLANVNERVSYMPEGRIDIGMIESILCDWSIMDRGLYYSGRNIDRQQERFVKEMMNRGVMLHELWEAREHVYQHRHLGEFGGWTGIDKLRMSHFKRTREILWSHEKR